MNLLSHLSWHRPTAHRLPTTAADRELRRYVDAAAASEAEGDASADASTEAGPPAGCGWFDSSHDLQSGLLVTEHASADAVASDLPLQAWLELHLAGWQPAWGGVQ